MPLFVSIALLLVQSAPPPLPSATYCAALFALTHDTLRQKSGDPIMTKGFGDDAAALRQIVITRLADGSAAKADALITGERMRLAAENAARAPEETVDLKPCYRVKALGRGGE